MLGSKKIFTSLLVVSSLCLSAVNNCSAQTVYAQIKGNVSDPTGAPIPGAEVTATNTQTGLATTVLTQGDGGYLFLQLPVGVYNVSISKPGFAKFIEARVLLVLNQVYNLPVRLQLGQTSQSLEVQANAAQIETASTQMDTVIEGQKIVNLPLNGRDWTQLEQLVPGVVAGSDRFGTVSAGNAYATNGSQSQQNAFLINGADTNDIGINAPLIVPSPDAIQEFNLIDSTINPEYGRNSGGILNAVIKSGTNQFHGVAFEFYRDTALNGRNLFQQSPPVFHQNQYGGTLGGPIRKNHTFFFLSYQGTRNRAPSGQSQTPVFTQAQRDGFFPAVANSTASSPFPLIGEDGTVYASGTPYSTLFPTGHIPTADFNPISAKMLNTYVPLPNAPGGLYAFNPIAAQVVDQGIARVDHSFGNSDSVWATAFFENSPTSETLPFGGATLPGFGELDTYATKVFTAGWNHTFNASTLNELRASFLRFNFQDVIPEHPALPSSFGFTGITPQNTVDASAPLITVVGYFNLGFSFEGPQPRIQDTYQLSDSFSKVAGNHNFKFGFSGTRYELDNPFFANNNGSFTFSGSGPYSTGDPGADFLLGIPASYVQGSGGIEDERTYEYYVYAQDSWKVNQNLTINYGVGYQIDTPLSNLYYNGEAFNCFRPGQQSTVFPTAPVGLVFPGDRGCSSSGYYNHYDHVGPRFGFAYSPGAGSDKKLVIRGGFGIYFNRTEEELALQNLFSVPFSLSTPGITAIGGSPSFANPFQDIATGQTIPNPVPFTPATKGTPVNFSQFFPLSINTTSPNFTDPYAMNYNFNIQRELPSAMILQIGYVGSLGRHLELAYEGNPISPAGQAECAADPVCIANANNQHVLYPNHATFAPGNIFGSVGTQATVGNSNYNSLQVSLNKHLTHGLSFLLAYTYSHSIDDTSGYENSTNSRGTNPYNFAADRGDSAFDARQRFVISYDYEIPRLSRLWNSVVARTLFDGWQLAGITTLQTGFPVTIAEQFDFRSLSCDQLSYYPCPDAPNYIGPLTTYNARNAVLTNTVTPSSPGTPQPNYYFNPNAFALETIGSIGNEGRNNFHGPGINNTDVTLAKRIYWGSSEQRLIELRLEAYNVFNHTQFTPVSTTNQGNGVDGNITDAPFGRVLSAASGRILQIGAKVYF